MSSSVSFVATNPATATSGSTAAIMYDNVAATLTLTLTLNNLPAGVTLPAGTQWLTLVCPRCFTVPELQAATLTPPTGQSAAFDGIASFDVSVGSQAVTWANGTTLTFTLASLQTTGPDSIYLFSARFNVAGSGLPAQATANLVVQAAPVNENADLASVLSVVFVPNGTDNETNAVYVSTITPYLVNSLWLNFGNSGGQPIFNGTTNPGKPQVTLSFTYGSDPGSLAPLNVADQVAITPTGENSNNWSAATNDQNDSWTWGLTPQTSSIIGIGSNANVTFSLANIIAPTAGDNVTQMLLLFHDFWQSDTVAYNDWTVGLPISKLVTPPGRGLSNFQSGTTSAGVTSPTDTVSIDFTWTMNFVAKVELYCVPSGIINSIPVSYSQQIYGATDSATVTVSNILNDVTLLFNLTGYDENGNVINTQQFSVVMQAEYFHDPRDCQLYAATPINGLMWMVQNLAWASPNSVPVNGDGSNTPAYGLLYPYSDASSVFTPTGNWRLAAQADYETLSALDYTQLTSSGTGLPDFQLAGFTFGSFTEYDPGDGGYYWTSTPNNSSQYPQAQTYQLTPQSASFQGMLTTGAGSGNGELFYLSVRYVRTALNAAQIAALREEALSGHPKPAIPSSR